MRKFLGMCAALALVLACASPGVRIAHRFEKGQRWQFHFESDTPFSEKVAQDGEVTQHSARRDDITLLLKSQESSVTGQTPTNADSQLATLIDVVRPPLPSSALKPGLEFAARSHDGVTGLGRLSSFKIKDGRRLALFDLLMRGPSKTTVQVDRADVTLSGTVNVIASFEFDIDEGVVVSALSRTTGSYAVQLPSQESSSNIEVSTRIRLTSVKEDLQ